MTPGMAMILAVASFVVWAGLVMLRGGFWRADQRLPSRPPELYEWPGVVAVVPARDEAATIGGTVTSLLKQDYPGSFAVVVVDDGSTDGTAEIARAAAAKTGAGERLTVVGGTALPPGWTGKLWAVKQGLNAAETISPAVSVLHSVR